MAPQRRPGARNRPVTVEWSDGASRLFNLVIALINSRYPRTTEWIVTNVAGYNGQLDSRLRAFRRDRKSLETLGIELTRHESIGESDERWSLAPAAIFLPEIEFSQEEKQVLTAATQWVNQLGDAAENNELATATARAFAKLSGTGVGKTQMDPVVQPVPDLTELDQASFDAIFRALDNRLQMSFWYYPSIMEEPHQRVIEPWAYGGVDGKVYVTGHDVDRKAQRTFRLSRISDVEALPHFAEQPIPKAKNPKPGQGMAPADGRELIEAGLARQTVHATATLEFSGTGGAELKNLAVDRKTKNGVVTGTVGPVDRDWLIQTAAGYAPDVIVVSPPDIVRDVMKLLQLASGEGEDD